MSSKEKYLDNKISKLVQSMEVDIPARVENGLNLKIEKTKPFNVALFKKIFLPLGIGTSAAMILITVLFLLPSANKNINKSIREIYTEFELKDKNIKIIFIQRPDFNLFMEEENE